MNRVLFFIDGFNVYHALQENPNYHKYKWLDYSALAKCYVSSKDEIVGILLFTAYAQWNPSKAARHQILISAARLKGVEIIFGKFKMRDRKCRKCNKSYKIPEEKYTDVNIAVKLFQAAINNEFDTAIIISADSDLVPAIKGVKENFPAKQIGLLTPIGRSSIDLKNICDFRMRMKEKHLRTSQLPDTIIIDAIKGTALQRPATWR